MPRPPKHSSFKLAAFFLLIGWVFLAATALAQDWKGVGRARGSVKNAEGQPLAGAAVSLRYEGKEGAGPTVKTDKKGNWSYIGLITGDFTAIVEAEGYVGAEAQIRIVEYDASASQPLVVELRKAEAPAGGNQAESGRLMGVLASGNEKLKNKQFAAARADYEAVLSEVKDPAQQAQLNAAIGDTYLGEGKGAEARAVFEKLLAETSEPAVQASYRQRIARGYYLEKKIDESVKTLDEVLAANPQDTASLRLIIDILVSAGREAQAEPYMARLPKGEKIDADTMLNLGITAYNAGEMDTAHDKFSRVLQDYPQNADAWYYLGLAELGRGKTAEAKAALERFLAIAPNHKSAADAKVFLAELK